jgi:hypothetical protein
MPGRLGPRFSIEVLFLIALAVGAAYADLAAKWIVLVMAGGWLVVALVELTADRIWAAAPPWRRPNYVPVAAPRSEPVAAPVASPVVESDPEPVRKPEPEPEVEVEIEIEAATIISQRVEPVAVIVQEPESAPEVQSEPEAEPELEPEPVAAELARPTFEPVEPTRKRRWFRRRESEAAEVDTPEIEVPKHVRLLPASERTDRSSDEVARLFDEPESEKRTGR